MDKKAKTILFKTYWTARGWREEYTTPPDDFQYAKAKGLMFDPLTISQENLIAELKELIDYIDKEKVAKGFLASLSNKRHDWRSALGSYSNAKLILAHKRNRLEREPIHHEDADISVLNFERIKWGGVRHSQLIYNYLDLTLFSIEEISDPSTEDINIFKNILDCIEASKPGDYPSKLRDNLKQVVKMSKDLRHVLMEILACCEILKPQSYDRPTTGRHDWEFVEFWRGEDKYQQEVVEEYFRKFLI